MVHHPTPADILGIAGEFFTLHRHVIPASDFHRHTEGAESFRHRLAEPVQIDQPPFRGIGDEGKV